MQHTWNAPRFDALYEQSTDPWALEGSWYEQRKRALVMASLPRVHYECAFEPGCAQGLLTAQLAQRCSTLLASDCSAQALALAGQRLQGSSQVRLAQLTLPEQWPEGPFDLVVLSELLYYLAPPALEILVGQLRTSLAARATVLACHWRRPIAGCALSGPEVHEHLHAALGWPRAIAVSDADFVLDVWTQGDEDTLAVQEGRA